MEKLALAIEIAELADAAADGTPIDVQREARRLLDGHPEAGSSERQVAETLTLEIASAGAAGGPPRVAPAREPRRR